MCVAMTARADIPVESLPDTSCVGLTEGAACGNGGVCTKVSTRRPDFSSAGAPTWVTVEVLVCRGKDQNEYALGSALAVLVVLAAWLKRRADQNAQPTVVCAAGMKP